MNKKVAIVTGGVAGIGRAIALSLVDDGYFTVVCDVNNERGLGLQNEFPDSIVYKHCNVADENEISGVVREVREKYVRIDALVNNAGIIRRRNEDEIKVSDWDIVFTVNVRGAFIFCKYVSEVMKEQQFGRIVNTSSVAGKLGDITSAPGYGPAKAALDGLTKTFARELAPFGGTANAVAPHAIETEMSDQWSDEKRAAIISAIPLKRLGRPEEVASVVSFLLSEGAGFITGEIIDVNGGFLMD